MKTDPLQVLILEDLYEDSLLVERELVKAGLHCSVMRVQTCHDYIEVLRHKRPDIILADYHVPGIKGFQALTVAREKFEDVPFIYVSAETRDEVAVESLQSGATDFVLKDRLSKLGPAVRRALDEVAERVQRRAAESQNHLFETLIKNSSDAIFFASEEGALSFLNSSGRAVFGIDSNLDSLPNLFQFFSKAQARRFRQQILPAILEEERWHGELQLRDYSQKRHILSGHFLRMPESNAVGQIAGIFTDVTEKRRLEQEVLSAATREQRRIGRNLHDGLGQTLTGILLHMQSFYASLRGFPAPVLGQAEKLVSQIKGAIKETRGLSHGMCPEDLKGDGLFIALDELSHNTTELFGVNCCFDYNAGAVVAHEQHAEQLYYITREAVNNALKHADAEEIQISLLRDNGDLRLRIADNGRGIPFSADKSTGIGLRLMEYRAKLMNAQLGIVPNKPSGTVVDCFLHMD